MPARAALAERRKALGLTQESLAELLRVERSTVARWEQGAATPRPWYRRRLADALQLAPDELGPLLDDRRPHIDSFTPAANSLDLGVPADDLVQAIRKDASRLVELDTKYGGDDLVGLATRAVRTADRRLTTGLVLRGDDHDMHAAIGELTQVAAWIAYDAERQTLARHLTTEALLHSRLAGDRQQELFELSQLAMQSIHRGRAGEAMAIAAQVIEQENPSPRVTAVFHIRRARAHALMGERARSLSEHDRAASELLGGTSSRGDPDWTWWVDASELAWHRAMSLVALDDRHAAIDLFYAAYAARPASAQRARYNDLAHLAEAQVTARSWHDAEDSLMQLVDQVPVVNSERTSTLLRRISGAVGKKPGAPSTLTDLSHWLVTLLP
jgi:transcriptional regulator with XRE-family HTH domain